MSYNLARNIKDFLCALLMALIIIVVVASAMCLIFPDKARHIYDCLTPAAKPEYASTTDGAMYYPIENLPDCFAHYLGYKPNMVFKDKGHNKGTVTFTFRGGYTVTFTVKQFAEKMWALEVLSGDNFSFREFDYQQLRYGCYSYEADMQAYVEYNSGLFYNIENCQNYFQSVTGRTSITLVHTMNLGKNEFYLATSDGKAKVTMKANEVDYFIRYDDEFLVSGQTLAQLLYDWEFATNQWKNSIHLGDFF